MGMGDAPKQQNIQDVYPDGTPFLIEKAWVEGVVATQFGDRTLAKVLVKPVGAGDGTAVEFACWGSLCEQVQQVEDGDVPGYYRVIKEGKRFLFQAVTEAELGDAAKATPTGDEADLGVTPQAGEGAGSAPAAGGEAPTS